MNKNLLLLVLVFIGFALNAQDKKTETSTAPVEAAPAPAPAPKKKIASSNSNSNPWEIGISGGLNYVWGDVSSRVKLDFNNSTFGVHIRKALTNSFSWRWQYNYGMSTMTDFRPHQTAVPNGWSSNPNVNTWFVASQMYSHSLSWDQVLTVGNSGMKKMNPKWTLDLFAGPAIFLYKTKLDMRDGNGNMYNWNNLQNIYTNALGSNVLSGDQRAKRLVSEAMDNTMDGKYETSAMNNGGKETVGGYAIVPAAAFGGSINRKISNRFSASLEHRIFYVFDDYLDGERFANFSTTPSYSQMNDMVHQTTLKVNYNLGKGTAAPLYWRNPNEELQKKLAEMNPRKEINAAFADDDGDGVPNILDQEPASREGCPVDTKGVMLDSDKDGLIDCDDKEPYSPAGYPVDNQGVAKVPPPACCADLEKKAVQPVITTQKPAGDCSETTLPSVTFEKDRFGLNSNSAVALQSIGEKMQKCPDMKLVVNGINDRNNKNGKYNEQLSYNRAMEVATYIEERFGVSRDRFIVRYNLEGTGDAEADRAVMFRNAQEGETGASNPPSPHPGLRAGKK